MIKTGEDFFINTFIQTPVDSVTVITYSETYSGLANEYQGRLRFLALLQQADTLNENSEIAPAVLRLKKFTFFH